MQRYRVDLNIFLGLAMPNQYCPPGAVLEGFLRFPETTQDFPSTIGVPLFGYNISRGIHSGLNSGVNWPLFRLEVKEM